LFGIFLCPHEDGESQKRGQLSSLLGVQAIRTSVTKKHHEVEYGKERVRVLAGIKVFL
jgi:hypothetical protein